MYHRDAEDDLDDSEYPDDDDDDLDETIPCPHCGEAVYEEAERCPYCGVYLSREDAPRRRLPGWFVVGFLLSMFVMVGWIFFWW